MRRVVRRVEVLSPEISKSASRSPSRSVNELAEPSRRSTSFNARDGTSTVWSELSTLVPGRSRTARR